MLTIITARGGSKGVPNKNIKLLAGKPLIQYTIQSALEAGLTNIYVNSDSQQILEIAAKLGAKIYQRPAHLATDTAKSIHVVLDQVNFHKQEGVNFQSVILLQPTYPFRPKESIIAAVKKFEQTQADSLISVEEIPHQYNPHWAFEERNGQLYIATGEENLISRRQDLPPAYVRDGSIYINKISILQSHQSFIAGKCVAYVNPNVNAVNIDTMADWERAEEIAKHNIN